MDQLLVALDVETVAEARAPSDKIVFAVRAVAVVQIRSGCQVTCAGEPPGHVLDKLIDAALVLHHDECCKRSRAIGHADMQSHGAAVRLFFLPVRYHSYLFDSLRLAQVPHQVK